MIVCHFGLVLAAGFLPGAAQPGLCAQEEGSEEVETLKKKEAPPASKTEPADSAESDAIKDEDGAKKPDSSPDKKPQKPQSKPGVTDQIIDGLIHQAKEQAENPLDGIIERMRAAQQKLQKTESDKETQELQAKIVKDLDELIEKLKNQNPPPKSSQNPNSPPPMGGEQNMPPRGGEQPKPQNSQKQSQPQQSSEQKGGASQQQNSAGSKNADKSRQSSDQMRSQQPRSREEEAARQRLAKDIWGHLPPTLRQQLLNVYSEKFLPKYDDQVRKYYEALAEQNRKNP